VGFEFLKRVRKTTVLTSLFLFIPVAAYLGVAAGVSWLAGCAWTLVNLVAIGWLVETLCARGEARRMRLVLIALVKVPVLYAVGFLLLRSNYLPLFPMLAGFLWPLLVIMLKILGRALLRMDDPRRLFARKNSGTIEEGSRHRSTTV
jgi:hypothetical protein